MLKATIQVPAFTNLFRAWEEMIESGIGALQLGMLAFESPDPPGHGNSD